MAKVEWIANYESKVLPSWEEPWDMTVDGTGNVYVVGATYFRNTNSSDYVTVKYNAAGNVLWQATYDGPGHLDDFAKAICLDDSGNVYVFGTSTGSGTAWDFATVKYNAEGVELWVRRYNVHGAQSENAVAAAVDR